MLDKDISDPLTGILLRKCIIGILSAKAIGALKQQGVLIYSRIKDYGLTFFICHRLIEFN